MNIGKSVLFVVILWAITVTMPMVMRLVNAEVEATLN